MTFNNDSSLILRVYSINSNAALKVTMLLDTDCKKETPSSIWYLLLELIRKKKIVCSSAFWNRIEEIFEFITFGANFTLRTNVFRFWKIFNVIFSIQFAYIRSLWIFVSILIVFGIKQQIQENTMKTLLELPHFSISR